MNFVNFIVLDTKVKEGKNSYTMSGAVLMKLDAPIPVIVKGKGCIGIGTPHQLTITSTSTDVLFTFAKVSKEACDAYYDLYRNQVSNVSSSEDGYEGSEDIMIPGAVGANMRRHQKPDNYNNSYRRSNTTSLSDFL